MGGGSEFNGGRAAHTYTSLASPEAFTPEGELLQLPAPRQQWWPGGAVVGEERDRLRHRPIGPQVH